MRVTAIMNNKGGVGKTSTTVNMAAILAHDYSFRVLVVDADSQANTTEFFGGVRACGCTFADLLRRMDVNDPVNQSNFEGVSLIGADDSLMDLDLSSVKAATADTACLAHFLQRRSKSTWDYVLIDCPPAFNAASAAALLAADDVIIPIKLDAFSLRGMANLVQQITNMRQINPRLRVAGLLPTMTYTSAAIRQAREALEKSKLPLFPPIRKSTKVDDMTYAQEPLIVSSPKSAACVDYRRFVTKYLAQEGGVSNG